MKDTTKCVESRQLHREDCLQEIRVDLFHELFTTCLQHPTKIQINAMSVEQLNDTLDSRNNILPNDKKYIQEPFSNNLMSSTEIKDWILAKVLPFTE